EPALARAELLGGAAPHGDAPTLADLRHDPRCPLQHLGRVRVRPLLGCLPRVAGELDAYPVVVGAWRVPRHIELRDALDHVLTVHAVVSARPRRRPTMSSEPPRDIPRGGKPLRGLHRVDD